MNLQKLISQPNFTVDDLKKVVTAKGLLIKKWNGRLLITYPNKDDQQRQIHKDSSEPIFNKIDFNDALVRECRGIILASDSETNDDSDSPQKLNIVCYAMDKFDRADDFTEEQLQKFFADSEEFVEELFDGSLVKMYYFQNQWVLSTNRCVEARRAKWNNYRSFYDMFQEATNDLNYDKLDKRCTYSFVLCHPENRIVVNYQTPNIIHVATRNLDTLEEVDVDIGIQKPLKLKMDYDTFVNRIKSNPYFMPGYVLKTKEGRRIVFECDNYKHVKQIKGNFRDPVYRYLQLKREDTNTFNQFVGYFPEYHWIDSRLETLAREAHKCYLDFFVNRNKSKFINKDLWELMSELHTLFLRTKEPTSLKKVRQHLKSYPLDKLARLVNMKSN